jgi:hypothetical protein
MALMAGPKRMRFRSLAPLFLAVLLAGCETAEFDPGPEPDAKTLLAPSVAYLFPGAPLVQGLKPIPAVPMNPGDIEIAPVRPAQTLAPGAWIACLRIDDKGRRRLFAAFFTKSALVHIREALPPDRCEGETYAMFRRKSPGPKAEAPHR